MVDFKRRVKQIPKLSVDERVEGKLQTSYARESRLRPLAVSKKHAAIRGMPKTTQGEVEAIAKGILAIKEIYQKKHELAHQSGTLRLEK